MNTRLGTLMALVVTVALTASTSAQVVERYVRFTIKDKSELDRLTRVVSIAKINHDTVHAYANEKEWAAFLSMGYTAVELPYPGWRYGGKVSQSLAGMQEWDSYPTYKTYLEMMARFASDFPSLCRLDTIGKSVEGRLILALKISTKVNLREDEPQFLYSSSMHGDELTGFILLLRLADYLLNQYGQATAEGQRVTKLLDNMEVWLNPLFNPDGTYRLGGDTSVSSATRYNANSVNLNRNFPDRVIDPINTTQGREPETQAMMLWTGKHNFTLSANLHSGAQVVNYPWDNGAQSGSYSRCPDDTWFMHVSRAYAIPNPDMMGGGFSNGITNGCAWYVIYGGRQDWMYWWNGGREVTIELEPNGIPSGSLLPQYWMHNKESFLAYMEEALHGIRGLVTDADTHAPLKARVDAVEPLSLPIYSDSTVGDYHYLLLPGTYSIAAQAPGYEPDTIRSIVVTDSLPTRMDIALRRIAVAVDGTPEDLPRQVSLSQNFPNPFNPSTTIRYSLPNKSAVQLTVFSTLGQQVTVLQNGEQEAGYHEVKFDGSGLSSGVYFYRLRAGNFVESKRLLLLR
jgi:murein tripeptide amidase MpaA